MLFVEISARFLLVFGPGVIRPELTDPGVDNCDCEIHPDLTGCDNCDCDLSRTD